MEVDMLKSKQRGWAALLPVGLIAIAATGGVIVAAENISDTPKPMLTNVLKGGQQERQGKVSVEFLEGKPVDSVAPAPAADK
jgi:hypothetical protein